VAGLGPDSPGFGEVSTVDASFARTVTGRGTIAGSPLISQPRALSMSLASVAAAE